LLKQFDALKLVEQKIRDKDKLDLVEIYLKNPLLKERINSFCDINISNNITQCYSKKSDV